MDGAGETRASLTGAPAGLASLTDEVTLSGPDGDRWVTATVTRNPDGSRRKLGLQLALAMVGPGGATGTIPAVTANPGPQADAVIDGVPMGRLDNAPATTSRVEVPHHRHRSAPVTAPSCSRTLGSTPDGAPPCLRSPPS